MRIDVILRYELLHEVKRRKKYESKSKRIVSGCPQNRDYEEKSVNIIFYDKNRREA